MPIYEYEPDDRECFICRGKLEVLQSLSEPACSLCPICGLPVKRLISKASVIKSYSVDHQKAGEKGFTTYRKAQQGVYEKIAGEGPELISKSKDFDSKSATPKKPKKIIDLDES